MVDYSTALPQQQYFQAPDLMQNAMRMQQMQTHGLQVQELARKRSEEAALRNITADPNSPEFARQAMLISPEFGLKAIAMQRQNTAADRASEASSRQAQEAVLRMANIHQTMGETAYTNAQNRLAAIPAGDAGSYAKWYDTFSPAYKGMNLPTPEQWAQDTNGQLKGHMIATSESARALAKPEVLDVGGVKTRYVPGTGTAQEIGITPFAPQGANIGAGAGTGPATAAMNPDRLAAMQDTQARLGLPPMQPSAAGANAAVNNMPGVPAPEAGAKNAMRAGPISAGDFARQQQEEADRRALVQEGLKTKAREEAKLAVATPEAERVKDIAKEGFATTLSNMVAQIQELGKKGMLVKPGETDFSNRVKAGLSDVSPRLTTMLSPERGENVATYANLRLSLLTALMDVTGKTSSQINSDKELSVNLDALSSPGQSVKSIADTLNNLSEQYGSGKKYTVEDLTGGKIQNPDADSGVPLGRRGVAPATAATPAAAPAAANVPAAAAARLKANPSEAPQFDAIFGVGSAARILGR